MTGIYIIKGRVSFSANIMAAAIKRSQRYNFRVREITGEKCVIEFFELWIDKWESIGVSEFTIQDARKAGTQNTEKFPRNMLFARAMSNGVRWYCPDVLGGPVYTPEELGAKVDGDGDVIHGEFSVSTVEPEPTIEQHHAWLASAQQLKADGKGVGPIAKELAVEFSISLSPGEVNRWLGK